VSPLHLRMEQMQFRKCCAFWFLEYQTTNEVQKPSNSALHTCDSIVTTNQILQNICEQTVKTMWDPQHLITL
jgi:hypothetical protein